MEIMIDSNTTPKDNMLIKRFDRYLLDLILQIDGCVFYFFTKLYRVSLRTYKTNYLKNTILI